MWFNILNLSGLPLNRIHRLYALALIYGRTLKEILSLYGIPL